MKKKVLTSGIMAILVASALAGCTEQSEPTLAYNGLGGEPETTYTVTSPEQCEQLGAGSKSDCEGAFNEATLNHQQNAPKFADQSSCESGSGAQCTQTQIRNSDGSFSSVFIPAMTGMIVGNMVGNMMNGSRYNSHPVYQDRDRRTFTSGGAYVPVGKGLVGSNTLKPSHTSSFSKPKASSMPKPSMKSGGFGSTGRGSSAAG